ncbi:MAG: LTA synthase family protein [Lachnospiraceae bacterium]|nr:LTA synthase family protein [Lachnospiraceae bacterium]
MKARKNTALFILDAVIWFLLAILIYIYGYLRNNFDTIKASELLFYLNTNVKEANLSVFREAFAYAVLIATAVTVLFLLFGFRTKTDESRRWYLAVSMAMGVALQLLSIGLIGSQLEIIRFFKTYKADSSFIEEHYADPKDVKVTFPEKKRNLIFLYLESMETTFSDKDHGGALNYNIIPELTALSCENINFSGMQEEKLNGVEPVFGATFTVGSMVSATSGLPLKRDYLRADLFLSSWDEDLTEDYLPNVRTLGDILEEEGYEQRLLIGSSGSFSGRDTYFENHGHFEVEDLLTMRNTGRLPKYYKAFWGYEDAKLFQFAREDLFEMAKGDAPFCLTLLTVDTHYPEGYTCELCGNSYKDPYSNVFACSSRQVRDFVDWIRKQDFYANTTIVIMGDHPTMNSGYLRWEIDDRYMRKSYLSVINPAEGVTEPDTYREYTALDLFPTTLAAMGVRIEGERLGLGVNLFSDRPTLAEEFGLHEVDVNMMMNSPFYNRLAAPLLSEN